MTQQQLSHDPLWPRQGSWDVNNDAETVDLTIVGIPTWRTSLSATQAHTTPDAVRNALLRYSNYAEPQRGVFHSIDEQLRFADAGNISEPDAPEGEPAAIEAISRLAERSQVVAGIGGDNAATVSNALGVWRERIETAGLITFDAHHDLRDGISNGSPVRRLIESGLDGKRIVQIGIADFANSIAYRKRAQSYGITVIPRHEISADALPDIISEALTIAGAAKGPIHVDLDVDVCDRSVVPACPASAPGGISAHELRLATRLLARSKAVESFDITEIDASQDTPDGRTIRLAALLILEIAAGIAER